MAGMEYLVEMRARSAEDDGQAAIAAAGQVGRARPGESRLRWERRNRCGGTGWCVLPGRHQELHHAVVVGEGDTAGGESSNRPGVGRVLVRAVEVPAEGGFGVFQNTNSLRSGWQRCCTAVFAAGALAKVSQQPTDPCRRGRANSDGAEEGAVDGGDAESWEFAQKTLADLSNERLGQKLEATLGEAAFYGPKIDFQARDALGRTHQVATIQLDLVLPQNFDLSCINEQGEDERIVMIHAAIAGSLERFISVLLEHTAGRLPTWMAPEQLRLITVSGEDKEMIDYAHRLAAEARSMGIRVHVDDSAESVGKKIRESSKQKVPYTVVIGEQEVSTNQLSPRIREDLMVGDKEVSMAADNFLQSLSNEIRSRTLKSSM